MLNLVASVIITYLFDIGLALLIATLFVSSFFSLFVVVSSTRQLNYHLPHVFMRAYPNQFFPSYFYRVQAFLAFFFLRFILVHA